MVILNMVGGGNGGGGYKSYTELKAMSLSDVITELNTDAQGYYDNLNGNGHIIGIGIANDDKTTYQCWDVSPVIYYGGAWRNGEVIIITMKTDSSGNLKIPKAGYGTGGSQNASYNWWVSYDGGSETQYSGTGSAGSITIASGLTADSDHMIVIRPDSESYEWARALGFYNSGVAGLLQSVTYDGSYKGYGSSATNTGAYFRGYQYRGCTSLTTAPQGVLPNSVTSIGNFFRYYQYYGCTGLTTAPDEVLSTGITSIGIYFRSYQYYGCTSLTTAPDEVLPNSVTSIGNYFRSYQYYGCTGLTTAPQEVLSTGITSIGNYFRGYQYRGCTSLTTAPDEVLSTGITSIGKYFRYQQYYQCTSLKNSAKENLPNSVTSIGDSFRVEQYRYDTTLIEIRGWIDLSIGNTNYRVNQYNGCTSNKTVKVFSDVGYASANSALTNSYVSVVLVPSAYLSNFTGASIRPRIGITDSKFIGY